MIQKIESYIRNYHMINAGDHVIAGVSGGADSVCLLLVLLQLRQKLGYTVSVVHVEHGIRGSAAQADAEFVRNFCTERGIECHIFHYNVPEYAKAHGMGEEEAGRYLRYAAFAEEKETYYKQKIERKITGKVKIAIAHNLNDNAETMLFHMARGTGISGLAGIAPVRGDIIRPLLSVSREKIAVYLAERGQAFCTDATNEADAYSRNWIRHHVLPGLNEVNRCAIRHMYQTAEELREIDVFLRQQARKEMEACCSCQNDSVKLNKSAFEQTETVLQKEMLHQILSELSGRSRDFTREHVTAVLDLFNRQNGRRVQLPYGLTAVRIYEGVEIYHKKFVKNEGKEQFSFQIIENFSNFITQISKKKYTKCFDYDKIKIGFSIRNRLPGDYLTVNDSGDRQKLKKYFINEKIPAKEREQIPLLADGPHIMWVVGHRISSYYKVTEYTRRILEVTFYGGEEDE